MNLAGICNLAAPLVESMASRLQLGQTLAKDCRRQVRQCCSCRPLFFLRNGGPQRRHIEHCKDEMPTKYINHIWHGCRAFVRFVTFFELSSLEIVRRIGEAWTHVESASQLTSANVGSLRNISPGCGSPLENLCIFAAPQAPRVLWMPSGGTMLRSARGGCLSTYCISRAQHRCN